MLSELLDEPPLKMLAEEPELVHENFQNVDGKIDQAFQINLKVIMFC